MLSCLPWSFCLSAILHHSTNAVGFCHMKYCLSFLALCSFALLVGCGRGGYAPVSGTVTVNGKPTANVRLVFAPMATDQSNDPGPPSVGVTDEAGRYELEARDGKLGAVPCNHRVSFKYADLELVGDLKFALNRASSTEKAAEYQAKIDHVESETKKRGAISRKSMTTFTVSESGAENADFEIGEDK